MENLSLWRISEEERRIERAIAEGGGELTPELEAAMDAVRDAAAGKVDAYRHVISRLEATAEAAKAEIDRLTGLKRACENGQKRLRESLLAYMTERGITRMEGELCTATLRLCPPKAVFSEEAVLSSYEEEAEEFRATLPSYVKAELRVDRNELRKAVERGEPVAASLVREQTVTIK